MRNGTMYFLCGLGIGAAAATLFAERSGAETRARLASAVGDGVGQLKSKAQELSKTVDETVQLGRETVQQGVRNLSAAVDAGKEAYRVATEKFSVS